MNRVTPRLSRVFSVTAFVSGLAVTLAAAALAGGPAFMKIGDISGEAPDTKHKGEIEIESWSWGAGQAGGMGSHAVGGGGGSGKANFAGDTAAAAASKVDALNVKQKAPAAQGKANDRLQTAGPRNGWKESEPGEAEITLKGTAAEERKRSGRVKHGDITLKRGASEAAGGVHVAAGDISGDGRDEAAQHKNGSLEYLNRNRHKELTAPAPAKGPGSVQLKAKSPWAGCRVGDRLLELSDSSSRYRLIDAVVTSCGAASDVVPTDQISLNYAKIEF